LLRREALDGMTVHLTHWGTFEAVSEGDIVTALAAGKCLDPHR